MFACNVLEWSNWALVADSTTSSSMLEEQHHHIKNDEVN